MQFLKRTGKAPKSPARARLIPAAMITVAAVLGLKAVAMAEGVAETGDAHASNDAAHAEAAPESATSTSTTASTQCEPATMAELAGLSAAEVQVLQALGERRQALDARGEQMQTQDALMLAAEQRLNERLAELRALETTVNDLLGRLDEEQETRIAALVDVYQRMRAKDAATVFDGLEDDVLVQVASRMRQANLAEVMGRMDPVRARRLTEMLADRARPPTGGGDLLARTRGETPAPAAPGAGR